MGAELVAAAGSLLGGEAANAIMGTPPSPGPDTNIPGGGISSATIEQANKAGGQNIKIAQVNPSNALNYFQQAAQQYTTSANTGINQFQSQMQNAINGVLNNTQSANSELTNLVNEGTPATNQYMQLLGLSPPTALQNSGLTNTLTQNGYGNIANLINSANGLTGQAALDAQKNIDSAFQSMNQAGLTPSQVASITSAAQAGFQPQTLPGQYSIANPVPQGLLQQYYASDTPAREAAYHQAMVAANPSAAQSSLWSNDYTINQINNQLNAPVQAQNAANEQAAVNTALQQAKTAQAQQTNNYEQQYNSLFTANPLQPYSGAQINNLLSQMPGYQFNLQQGEQAINRQAAQNGLLASGGTGTSLVNYAQNLASNTYQNMLNNLSPLMSTSNSAMNQIASNYINQGGSLAQLYGNLGSGLLNAYQNIGQSQYNASTNAGQTTFNADMANMQAQNQAIAQANQQNFQASQNANQNALQAGYLNLQNNMFNYQLAQNQQAGQTFAQGALPQGSSSGAGTGWPSYNPGTMAWYTV